MYSVPYSKTQIEFELPPGMCGTVVVSQPVEPVADVQAALEQLLAFAAREGIRLSEINTQTPTLEDAFMSLVTQGGDPGEASS